MLDLARIMGDRMPPGSSCLSEELRRRFELEGEAALILRLELPSGDPWRPEFEERRAAIAWLVERHRLRRGRRVDSTPTTATRSPALSPPWALPLAFILGVIIGLLLGLVVEWP